MSSFPTSHNDKSDEFDDECFEQDLGYFEDIIFLTNDFDHRPIQIKSETCDAFEFDDIEFLLDENIQFPKPKSFKMESDLEDLICLCTDGENFVPQLVIKQEDEDTLEPGAIGGPRTEFNVPSTSSTNISGDESSTSLATWGQSSKPDDISGFFPFEVGFCPLLKELIPNFQISGSGGRIYNYNQQTYEMGVKTIEALKKYNSTMRQVDSDLRFIVALLLDLNGARNLSQNKLSKNLFEFIGIIFKVRVYNVPNRMAQFAKHVEDGIKVAKELVKIRMMRCGNV